MPRLRFLFFNASGAVVWVTSYGLAGYILGAQIERVRGSLAIVGVIVAIAAAVAFFRFVRRHETALEEEADLEAGGS